MKKQQKMIYFYIKSILIDINTIFYNACFMNNTSNSSNGVINSFCFTINCNFSIIYTIIN